MRPPVEIIEEETEIHGEHGEAARGLRDRVFGLKMTSKLIQRIFEMMGVARTVEEVVLLEEWLNKWGTFKISLRIPFYNFKIFKYCI